MDSKELRSLNEAWNQVQGVNQTKYARGLNAPTDSGVKVNVTEENINLIVENAMARVFYGDLQEVETKETREGTKYKVRVKDRQSGSSYIRFATREKIAELRSNPNIASVELTDETPANSNAQGTTGTRQGFGQGPNANRGNQQSAAMKRYEREREMQKKAFGMGAGV